MDSFGVRFKLTTFGESHGACVGGVIEGIPAGLAFDEEFINSELAKRRGGGRFATPRKEEDKAEFLSGVFEGKFTGTACAFVVKNSSQHSKDYENLRSLFRPSHADFGYFAKFGVKDHRGGGRASARESAARVVAGAVAQLILREFGIEVTSGVCGVGAVRAQNLDFLAAQESEIFFLDKACEEAAKGEILAAKSEGDSVGGVVATLATGVQAGLGEPLYDKLDARIGAAFLGLNGVKAVEVGEGTEASKMRGSQHNDAMKAGGEFNAKMSKSNLVLTSGEGVFGRGNFATNHCGGILGGLSTGEEIFVKSHFKPTASIFAKQSTLDTAGREVSFSLKGRHDPCIAVRGSVVLTAMMRLILVDFLLLNQTSKMSQLVNLR